MDIDLNKSLIIMNISDLMASISMTENISEKIEKLNIYVEELNAEMLKIKELECDSPLCILVLTEAIQKVEKEIMWYTNMKADSVTNELMPLTSGDSKGAKRQEESNDADKKNLMSVIQLGSNNVAYDTTVQSYASHGNLSELIREDIATDENPNSQICINLKKRKSAFVPYQRSSGVINGESFNINSGQHFSVGVFGLNSFNMNFNDKIITNLTFQPSLMDSSKKPRLSWTHDLHREFLQVVEELGGPFVATPKQIRNRMGIDGLTNDEIKSHLQKYRQQLQKQYSNSTSIASTSKSLFTDQGGQTAKSSLIGQGGQGDKST